jgi:hypothetical protein
MSAPAIPPVLAHYLATGCWAAPTSTPEERFELFMLSGAVFRGHLAGLRAIWQAHGVALRTAHRGPIFAEEMLAGRLHRIDTQSWPKHFGRTRCLEHAEGERHAHHR